MTKSTSPLERVPSHETTPSDLPGEPMAEWNLFDVKAIDGNEAGFTSPDGEYFPLRADESLVHVGSGKDRDTFIRTAESLIPFDDWEPKVVSDNMERLRNSGEVGQYLVPLYAAALAEDPRLRQVIVNTSGSKEKPVLSKTGGFANHHGQTESGKYEVTFNTNDGWEHFETLLTARGASAKLSAEKLGIEESQMDEKMLAGFIFLHEMGHIVDYMDNAPDPEEAKARRMRDMNTLPWPGWNPASMANFLASEEGKALWPQHAPAWRQKGITTPEQLLAYQEERYHDMKTEDNPDRFAAWVLNHLA